MDDTPATVQSRKPSDGKPRPKPPRKGLHILAPAIVEVGVSARCSHGCFGVAIETQESVWTITSDSSTVHAEPGQMMTFHHHQDDDPECWGCWDGWGPDEDD